MDESELDLSCIGLVTAVGEVVEDGFGFVGDAWRRGDLLTAQADGCRSQRPQGLDYLLGREAGAGLGFTRDCESGETRWSRGLRCCRGCDGRSAVLRGRIWPS
jgi:hypothetical protein